MVALSGHDERLGYPREGAGSLVRGRRFGAMGSGRSGFGARQIFDQSKGQSKRALVGQTARTARFGSGVRDEARIAFRGLALMSNSLCSSEFGSLKGDAIITQRTSSSVIAGPLKRSTMRSGERRPARTYR
jgi:hypothetical protein